VTIALESIPESLRKTPQWIVYRRDHEGAKVQKRPVDHRTGRVHDAHDPAIWMTFEQAIDAQARFDGIGFVFTDRDPFLGIDLDKCVDENGEIEPWAEQVIDCFQSYAEFSPSRTGIHIIIRGRLPDGTGHSCNGLGANKAGKIEVYDRLRFFTVTGQIIEGSPREVLDRNEEFVAFCRARLPRVVLVAGNSVEVAPNRLSDDEIIDLARTFWPGRGRFDRLFIDGELTDYEGDQNRADMALCNFLSFWSGGSSTAMDRIFRRSALMRDKWDSKRGTTTYGGLTIAKVISTAKAFFDPGQDRPEKVVDPSSEVIDPSSLVVRASTIDPEPVDWLWSNRIPRGFISIFAGRTGIGKSFVTLDIVARITTGGKWPDSPEECATVGNVLILSEDPQKQVLVPRLIAMGADLEKVWFMTWKAMSRYTLSNTEMLGQAAGMSGDPILIIIDPPTNFMGVVDEHRNAEVRTVLMFLVAWLEGRSPRVAMILITHVSKAAKGVDAIARIIGSVAWVSTSRIAHMFAPDPDHYGQSLFLCPKNNLGPCAGGLAYRVVKSGDCARVEWLGPSTTSADDAMSGEKKKPVPVEAAEWITERFREKRSWRSEELKQAAVEAGHSTNAIFKNARIKALPIKRKQHFTADGASFWLWTAQGNWPSTLESESAESAESVDVSPCDKMKINTFGPSVDKSESAESAESVPTTLSEPSGSTFGTLSETPESLEKLDLPLVYDDTFGTFGVFGSAFPRVLESDPVQEDLSGRALRFLAGILRLDRELPRGHLLEWAGKNGIPESDLLDAAERLGVRKTLDEDGELWKLEDKL
jgi:putative DNA primase/helicase